MQSGTGSTTELNLDMQSLPNGLYFLRMADLRGGIPVTRPVVVQR
jgi:hypothetical protein